MFIEEFRERLQERGLTVATFARLVGLHRVTVCQWPHPKGWVDALFAAWDEIDRLRAMLIEAGIREKAIRPPKKTMALLPPTTKTAL